MVNLAHSHRVHAVRANNENNEMTNRLTAHLKILMINPDRLPKGEAMRIKFRLYNEAAKAGLIRNEPYIHPKQDLFLYGALSLPHILRRVLDLPEPPVLEPIFIAGFKVKMWGKYPSVVKDFEGDCMEKKVQGVAFIASEEQTKLLEGYAGENYKLAPVMAMKGHDDGGLRYMFEWCGPQEELTDGNFDPDLFE